MDNLIIKNGQTCGIYTTCSLLIYFLVCLNAELRAQVTGGLQMLFKVCSTPHFSVPSKGGVCGPGTLWIYFEGAVDTSFNVIYLGDDQLRITWCTNNLSDAAAEIIIQKLCTTPKRGASCLYTTNTPFSYLVQQTLTFTPHASTKLFILKFTSATRDTPYNFIYRTTHK